MDFTTWVESKKGRASATAARFSVSKAAISQWKRNGVPLDHMKSMRDFTGGEVTLEEMVPAAQPQQQAA